MPGPEDMKQGEVIDTGALRAATKEEIEKLKQGLMEQQVRERNKAVNHRIDFGPWGYLKFQEGPRHEVGINGLFLADDVEVSVIPALIQHLKNLNAVLPSRETSLAITKLEECNMWLLERKRNRQSQAVLGTYKPHTS